MDRRQRQHGGFFGVARRAQTYRNLLYLVLAFPISWLFLRGLSYLWWSLGLYSFPSLLFALLVVFAAAWPLTICERWLAHGLLRVEFTPMAPPVRPETTLWQRLQAHLRSPVTWKSLVYLIVRVPFGVVASAAVVVAAAITALLLVGPIILLVATLGARAWPEQYLYYLNHLGLHRFAATLGTQGLALDSLLLIPLGVLVLLLALYALNGIARGWGWFAQQMLGMNPKDAQLAEARATAAEARSRADESERGRRQLILDASHELRTPVATIRAHLESVLLLEGERLPQNVRSYLSVTAREAERLGGLVDDLLMLARADSDELQLDVQPVDAGGVVEEVFAAMEPLADRERQITLVHEVTPDLPLAHADRERLVQVLLNLARNAIMYTPDGGLISIALAAGTQPYTLDLSVTDTGIGIPEAELEQIFERFYRTDASRARHTGGFGLGLSIARDLVQAMGGTLTAERVPSGGSRFRVTLRAATSAATE